MFVLSTGSLHNYGLDRVFALARTVGFGGAEVIVDHRWDTRQADYLRLVSDTHGVPILSLHAPFVPGIQGWEEDPIVALKRTVELARALDVHIVVTHLPHRWHWVSVRSTLFSGRRYRLPLFWPQGQEYLHWLAHNSHEVCADSVRVLVENMPVRRLLGLRLNPYHFNTPEALLRFNGLVLDTTHLGTWDADVLAVYERLKTRIKHVHLSDYDGREHRPPGQGRLPLDRLLRRMAADGYGGHIVIESGPEYLGAGRDTEVERALHEALRFCQEHFRRDPSCSNTCVVSDSGGIGHT